MSCGNVPLGLTEGWIPGLAPFLSFIFGLSWNR